MPITTDCSEAVAYIKKVILISRYHAAKAVNKELLSLYYHIGKYISINSRARQWGKNILDVISKQLQSELPGLRGFSATSLKKMRTFYEAWDNVFEKRPLTTDESPSSIDAINRPLTTDVLSATDFELFSSVSFTHHYELIIKTSSIDERLFYIRQCALEYWSVDKLKYYLKEQLHLKKSSSLNNFSIAITDTKFRENALLSFKDEYLLDFINIEDPDELDERLLESEIVSNIKKFIMALGHDFAFLGNQYRIIVDDTEYFIDLLFYNRKLQSLVAIELKRGEFKPEYAGKMNFYLSALDEYVKLPHENHSIGIILCRSQKSKIVEFAFRDSSKPMGVATYKLSKELPAEIANYLPNAEDLINLLN